MKVLTISKWLPLVAYTFLGTLLSYICVLVHRWLQGWMCLQIRTSHLHLDGADVLSDGGYLHYAFARFLVKSGLFEKEMSRTMLTVSGTESQQKTCFLWFLRWSPEMLPWKPVPSAVSSASSCPVFLVHQQSCLCLYLCFAAFFLLVSIGIISEFTNSPKDFAQPSSSHTIIHSCL